MLSGHHKLWVGLPSAIREKIIEFIISAVYTVLYAETDPNALTKYQFWRGMGALVTFGVSAVVFLSKEKTFFLFSGLVIFRLKLHCSFSSLS